MPVSDTRSLHASTSAAVLPKLGFEEGALPASEAGAGNAVKIPLYPGLRDKDQNRIADSLKEYQKS